MDSGGNWRHIPKIVGANLRKSIPQVSAKSVLTKKLLVVLRTLIRPLQVAFLIQGWPLTYQAYQRTREGREFL